MNRFDPTRRAFCRSTRRRLSLIIPTEQDVSCAIAYWQCCSEMQGDNDECPPGRCFCCDAARELAGNLPFIEVLKSILEQVRAGKASDIDALLSIFAFGLLTAAVIPTASGNANGASAMKCRQAVNTAIKDVN